MKKIFVALQLYTIRDFANDDAAGSLRKVKEMGYDYVELAGTYDLSFQETGNILSELELAAISAHVSFDELRKDLAGTISAYKSLGCEYIIISMLKSERLAGGEEWEETKDFLKQFCAACKAAGVIPAYHNHAHEFEKLANGEFVLDAFFRELPEISAQLDTGWIKAAGQSPEAYIKKYAGRCPVVHIKDTIENSQNCYVDTPVGQGSQNIPATVEVSAESGVSGFVVELDRPHGKTSLEAARESREYLKSLGY